MAKTRTKKSDTPIEVLAAPRVDRRLARTRAALMGAGQRLFGARNFDGVTIDDIVESADVAKGSFYNHFEDKQSLADAIVELVQSDCEREVSMINTDINDPATRMARAMVGLVRYSREHPDRYRAMVNLTKRADVAAPINAGVRHDIEIGLASGQYHSITIEGGVLVAFGMIAYTIDYLSNTQVSKSPQAITQEMAFMLLRALGVRSPKAKSVSQSVVAELLGERTT